MAYAPTEIAPYNDRPLGLSAFIRAKDEQRWIGPAIASIVDDVDEVVVCLQPSRDRTEAIVRGFRSDKVRIVPYPVETRAFGPGFDTHDPLQPDCWTYFCNWSLAQTRFSSAIRWDADHIALPGAISRIRGLLADYDAVFDFGVNVVTRDLHLSRALPRTFVEARNFRVLPGFSFESGSHTEVFRLGKFHRHGWRIWKARKYFLPTPTFLHLKWLKTDDEMRGWPENWRDVPYFAKADRREAGARYDGPRPTFDFLSMEAA